MLDWLVHKPDLPPYPGDAHLHGLGLWNSMPVTLALEAALFAGGIYLYMASTRARDRIGALAVWALVATLLVSYLGATFVDRHREARLP